MYKGLRFSQTLLRARWARRSLKFKSVRYPTFYGFEPCKYLFIVSLAMSHTISQPSNFDVNFHNEAASFPGVNCTIVNLKNA